MVKAVVVSLLLTAQVAFAQAFPVMVAHKFGSTTVEAEPERVLSLGYTDHDAIIALGFTPIAVRYWFGPEAEQIKPWAQALIGDAQPEVLNMPELNFEAITALEPDIIIATYSGITQAEYETLSQIAPTIAQTDAYVDYGMPWQEQTRLIAQALGKTELAETLIAENEARFTEVRAQHPEFAGKTAVIAATGSGGELYFSGREHERMRFLIDIGFELPEDLDALAGDSFYGEISQERYDLFDVDLLIWHLEDRRAFEEVTSNPVYGQLTVAKNGHDLFVDADGGGENLAGLALNYTSVLSLPIIFDGLVPEIAALIGDDAEAAAE